MKKRSGYERRAVQDVIMETLDQLARTQRFLSDVFDESGRRAPNALEITNMRSDLKKFMGGPNKGVFLTLLGRYRMRNDKHPNGQKEMVTALEKMFYVSKDTGATYKDWKSLRDDIFKRKIYTPDPIFNPIFIGNTSMKETPGNFIVDQLDMSYQNIQGYDTRLNKGKPLLSLKQVTDLLDDVEMIGGILDRSSFRDFANMFREGLRAPELMI